MNPFDAASPFDARYYFADRGFLRQAAIRSSPRMPRCATWPASKRPWRETLADFERLPVGGRRRDRAGGGSVTPEEVYEEERRIQHNIRALVNCIGRRSAQAPALRASVRDLGRHHGHGPGPLPGRCHAAGAAARSERAGTAIDRLARAHADTPQMGRTHGQHAVPITFGFAVALYVSRLGSGIEIIAQAAGNLRGKFAGAVGAYNALSLS